MPTVRLLGHANAYPVADVLRLFYGQPAAEADDGSLRAGDDEPLIISSQEPADVGLARIVTVIPDQLAFRLEAVVTEKLARREIKRQLYQLLSHWTGLSFPWGSLTGIRPTLVAAECLARLGSVPAARHELTNYWLVSAAKADLALETAQAEQALLRQIQP